MSLSRKFRRLLQFSVCGCQKWFLFPPTLTWCERRLGTISVHVSCRNASNASFTGKIYVSRLRRFSFFADVSQFILPENNSFTGSRVSSNHPSLFTPRHFPIMLLCGLWAVFSFLCCLVRFNQSTQVISYQRESHMASNHRSLFTLWCFSVVYEQFFHFCVV